MTRRIGVRRIKLYRNRSTAVVMCRVTGHLTHIGGISNVTEWKLGQTDKK